MEEIKKKTKVLVNGIIQNKDKILLIKRLSDEIDDPAEWEFPGGRLEFGEDPKDGVLREIKEETGLDVEYKYIYEILNKEYTKPGKRVHLMRIIHLFETEQENVKLNPREHEDYKWVTKEEAKNMNISSYLKNLLD